MPNTTLKQDLIRLRKLKGERDRDKERAAKSEEKFKTFQMRVLERMEAEEVDGLKTGGTTFSPVEQVYATVQDRSEFVAWAKATDPELVADKERGSLLNALVRQRLDDGEELPPGIGFRTQAYVAMRNS